MAPPPPVRPAGRKGARLGAAQPGPACAHGRARACAACALRPRTRTASLVLWWRGLAALGPSLAWSDLL
eukprot:1906430-Lingulodinium_polyedra.AAC.1